METSFNPNSRNLAVETCTECNTAIIDRLASFNPNSRNLAVETVVRTSPPPGIVLVSILILGI